jgi:hypothetical protein
MDTMEKKKFKDLVEHHCELIKTHKSNSDVNLAPVASFWGFQLKARTEICEDCGVIVENRVVTYSKSMSTDYWTKKCSNCPLKSTSKNFKL